MFKVVGFESDYANGLAEQVNRWMADHPQALLISIVMAGTTTEHGTVEEGDLWGALATFRFAAVPS